MARKSRKNKGNIVSTRDHLKSSDNMVGVYIRLSVEDNGDKTKDSIQNQILYLKEFVERNREEFQLVQIYVDNGTTGTNFDRENWNRLLEDMKSGKINCIIVKDFSRIGRNYIEVVSFGKSFQLLDDTVCVFRIVFSDPGFYPGGIKDGHGCKGRIKLLADRFGQINQVVEHRL